MSAPASTRRAAMRSESALVVRYWKRPVSVTRPTYSASAICGVSSAPSRSKTDTRISAVDDACAVDQVGAAEPGVVVVMVDVDHGSSSRPAAPGLRPQPPLVAAVQGQQRPAGQRRRVELALEAVRVEEVVLGRQRRVLVEVRTSLPSAAHRVGRGAACCRRRRRQGSRGTRSARGRPPRARRPRRRGRVRVGNPSLC